ncbi:MAG: hypothetical protein ACTSVE_10525 [Candidatus Helarchaeota archaeon]
MCEDCYKCGFEQEIKKLVERKSFRKEWQVTYKSMNPTEIVNFLSRGVRELNDLDESKPKISPLLKGIVINCLFKEILEIYPGNLISVDLRNKLKKKFNEKTNLFEMMRVKLEKFIQDKQYKEFEDELRSFFKFYDKLFNSNEFIQNKLNGFLYKLLNNFKEKEIDASILTIVTNSYLKFMKYTDGDLNLALFFIQLGTYFSNNGEKSMAKKCLLKSKTIFHELGHEKDEAKIEKIISKINVPIKSKKRAKKLKRGKKKK